MSIGQRRGGILQRAGSGLRRAKGFALHLISSHLISRHWGVGSRPQRDVKEGSVPSETCLVHHYTVLMAIPFNPLSVPLGDAGWSCLPVMAVPALPSSSGVPPRTPLTVSPSSPLLDNPFLTICSSFQVDAEDELLASYGFGPVVHYSLEDGTASKNRMGRSRE
jgi:hypothetical protein